MGPLETRIVRYLQVATGTRQTGDIHQAIDRDYPVSRNTICQTLKRMRERGLVERTGWGEYQIKQPNLQAAPDLLVAYLIDRLFRDYPATVRRELERRGWSEHDESLTA